MAVYNTYSKKDTKKPDLDEGLCVNRETNFCFYCGKVLDTDPAINWIGQTAEIYLHARCTIEFMLRISSDVHDWESKTGKKVTAGPRS